MSRFLVYKVDTTRLGEGELKMIFENNEMLQFYSFFLFLCILAIVIIINTHKRNMRISKGCYRNGGQDIIFLCDITKEEVIYKLTKKTAEDTLFYDFFVKDKKYYINVKGLKKFNRRDILTGLFEIKFVYTSKGMYIVMSLTKKWHCIYTGIYEIALYEFIICKIGGIPVECVQ